MRRSIFKVVLLTVLVVSLALQLCGCGGSSATKPDASGKSEGSTTTSSKPSSSEKIQIKMWTFLNPESNDGRGKALKKMIENYQTKYPNVTVTVEPQQWQTMTAKFVASAEAGNAPDIGWCIHYEGATVIAQNLYVPFEDLFLNEWSEEDKADIDDVFWRMSPDGKHYCVYLNRNLYGIIYRKDLFEAAGIEPKFNNWDELVVAAQKLTKKDPKTGLDVWGLGSAYAVDGAETAYMMPALMSREGGMVAADGKANWADQDLADALKFQIDMIDKYKITPSTALVTDFDGLVADFCSGKYAMTCLGAVRIPSIKSQCTFDPNTVDIIPYPDIYGKTSLTDSSGWLIGVWSGSSHKQEAGRFVEEMMSKEGDELWAKLGGQAPIRKSTFETMKSFFAQPGNQYFYNMADILDNHSRAYPPAVKISAYKGDLNKAMQLAYVDKMDPLKALQQVSAEFNARNAN